MNGFRQRWESTLKGGRCVPLSLRPRENKRRERENVSPCSWIARWASSHGPAFQRKACKDGTLAAMGWCWIITGRHFGFAGIPFDLYGSQPSACWVSGDITVQPSSLFLVIFPLLEAEWQNSYSFIYCHSDPSSDPSSKLFLSEFGPETLDLWKLRMIALKPQGHKRRLLFLIVEHASQNWGMVRMFLPLLALLGRSYQILCFFPTSFLTSYLQSYTNHFGF